MSNQLRKDWIHEVSQNVIWMCQLPRSGGTLMLRLLDSHPEIHNYPAVFGFNTEGKIWPEEKILFESKNVLDDVLSYMNLEKFHLVGIRKKSSNINQKQYPVYFDVDWYREIFDLFFTGKTPKNYFDAYFTALFNAWRNYQNLYGEKKLITGQMTLQNPKQYRTNFVNFRKTYPDGKIIFILRNIDDWLASTITLKHSTIFHDDPYEIMDYYKTIMKQLSEIVDKGSFIIFRFEDLVFKPNDVMSALAKKLGVDWNENLLKPTFNGAPFYQNSSFEIEQKACIDPNVVGQGKRLDKKVLSAIDQECYDLYKEILCHKTI